MLDNPYYIVLSKDINKEILKDLESRFNSDNRKSILEEIFEDDFHSLQKCIKAREKRFEKEIGIIFVDNDIYFEKNNSEFTYIAFGTLFYKGAFKKAKPRYYLNQADILKYITLNELIGLSLHEFLENIKPYKGELICL